MIATPGQPFTLKYDDRGRSPYDACVHQLFDAAVLRQYRRSVRAFLRRSAVCDSGFGLVPSIAIVHRQASIGTAVPQVSLLLYYDARGHNPYYACVHQLLDAAVLCQYRRPVRAFPRRSGLCDSGFGLVPSIAIVHRQASIRVAAVVIHPFLGVGASSRSNGTKSSSDAAPSTTLPP